MNHAQLGFLTESEARLVKAAEKLAEGRYQTLLQKAADIEEKLREVKSHRNELYLSLKDLMNVLPKGQHLRYYYAREQVDAAGKVLDKMKGLIK